MDNIFKKLNKKEKQMINDMLEELKYLKDENDELIFMFVNEKCFKNVKNKICKKYKDKNPILNNEECCPLCLASIADEPLSTKAIIYGMIEIV
jgi:hypothetical protein